MDIPAKGRDPLEVGNELVNDVFEQAMLTQHPRFFSFVASAVSPYSLAGSILTDVYNLHVGGWEQATGTDLLAELIEYSFYNANVVKRELTKRPNWEIVSNPSCGTINFRYAPEGLSDEELDELTGRISKEIISRGFAFIVTTTLQGKRTLRMCTINANTTEDDILQTISLLDEIAQYEWNNILCREQ